jgi:hypothetical protein
MKKYISIFLIFFFSMLIAGYYTIIQPSAQVQSNYLGAFDPEDKYEYSNKIISDQFRIDVTSIEISELVKLVSQSIQKRRQVIININLSSKTRFSSEIKQNISNICNSIEPKDVKLNWSNLQEGIYLDNAQYVDRYNQFVEICRQVNNKHHFIYSLPEIENKDWYLPPSNMYNSFGVNLDLDKAKYDSNASVIPSFTDLLDQYYNFLKPYNKEIYITRLRIHSDPVFRKRWFLVVKQVMLENKFYPLLKLIILDNAVPHYINREWVERPNY